MKGLKERLVDKETNEQNVNEEKLCDDQIKMLEDAWVPKSVISILKDIDSEEFVPFDRFVSILCEIYKDKYNK